MSKTRVTATALARPLERTGDRRVDQAQRNVHPIASALNANPLTPTSGKWVKGQAIAGGGGGADTVVQHGLGRPIAGWCFTRVKGNPPSAYEKSSTSTSLTIHNTGSAFTADLWIF